MNGGREEGASGTCVLLAVCSRSGLSCQATFPVNISILMVLEKPLPLAPSTGVCVTPRNFTLCGLFTSCPLCMVLLKTLLRLHHLSAARL